MIEQKFHNRIKQLKVLLIILVIISIAGCSSNGIKPEESPNVIEDEKVDINLYVRDFYGSDPKGYIEERQQFIDRLNEEFNIKIVIELIEAPRLSGEDIQDNGGLVKVRTVSIPTLIKSESINPLDIYLSENSTWENLPEYFKENASFNGSVWGIPAYSLELPTFYTRFIRDDWLNNLNKSAPETIEEYYEILKQFTYNDPDKNGIDDTTGFISVGLQGLYDIFNSYDCPIGFSNRYQQAWNPTTNMFVDGLQSENISDCLQFLNGCYSERILHPNFQYTDQKTLFNEYYKGKIGSLSQYLNFHDDIEIEMGITHTIIPALKGIRKDKIVMARMDCEYQYVLSSSVKNGKDTVNAFVDVFLGNELGYFMGKYGLPDTNNNEHDFYIESERVVLHTDISSNRIIKKEYPTIIEGHPAFSKYEIEYSRASQEEYPTNVVSNYDRNLLITTYTDYADMIYTIAAKYQNISSSFFSDAGVSSLKSALSDLGTETIYNCITGKVNIEDALDNYRSEAAKMGLDDILNKVNIAVQDRYY